MIGGLANRAETSWLEWPVHEESALANTLHAYWRALLSLDSDDEALRLDRVLSAVADAEPTLDWYLDEWGSFSQPHAAHRLAEFLDLNSEDLSTGRLWNPPWRNEEMDRPTTNELRLLEWLRSDQLRVAVLAASALASDPEEMAAFDEIIAQLTRLGSS
jgi:hypothetical protein